MPEKLSFFSTMPHHYSKRRSGHLPLGFKLATKKKRIKIHGKNAIKIDMKIKTPEFKQPVEMKSIITGPEPIIKEMGRPSENPVTKKSFSQLTRNERIQLARQKWAERHPG